MGHPGREDSASVSRRDKQRLVQQLVAQWVWWQASETEKCQTLQLDSVARRLLSGRMTVQYPRQFGFPSFDCVPLFI